MVAFSISNITSSSARITVSGLTSGDTVRIYLRRSDADTAMHDTEYIVGDTSFSISLPGLSDNTEYAANVKVNDDWLGAQYFTTLSDRPINWSWDNDIAVGRKISLSAAEWNDFCNRINEFRVYAGLSEYSFTTVYSGTTKISADIVNQARTAISAINGCGTLPSQAYSGDPITASFFLTLSSALNAIP